MSDTRNTDLEAPMDTNTELDTLLFNTAAANARGAATGTKQAAQIAELMTGKTMAEVMDKITMIGLRMMTKAYHGDPEAKARIDREGAKRMAVVYVGKVCGVVEAAMAAAA